MPIRTLTKMSCEHAESIVAQSTISCMFRRRQDSNHHSIQACMSYNGSSLLFCRMASSW